MKIRNRKTGAIYNIEDIEIVNNEEGIWLGMSLYKSLAELNEEWEDCEEKKFIYYIDWKGNVQVNSYENDWEKEKSIGNYFETKEEAELAVRKLKAWKLLKDECDIKFDGIIRDDKAMLKCVKLSYDRHTVTVERMRECVDALHLLFGGEVKNETNFKDV